MKKVDIKYNPYLVETVITIDGHKPKPNSALNVGKRRLQEWVEQLPEIILNEYRDPNLEVNFTGTSSDYEDVKASFDSFTDGTSVQFSFHKVADITDVERTIDAIFDDIQKGPIPELRDKRIVSTFNRAKNSQFEINVVATMSSGKSTLINALLGQQLMPAANEATTSTIVKIIDTPNKVFSATAYDKSGQKVAKIDKVNLEDMKKLNSDVKVSLVEIRGKIPFVDTVGMRLVLVDTPGPNNSRDKSHEVMTYKMIADSDKSLVLYVMNGQQLGINDEKVFLDYVCQTMREGGKQSRERFIFAVNKLDSFKPKDEGADCIEKALRNVKAGLEDRGIYRPNIFPVTSLAALELRTDDDEPMSLDTFKRGSTKYGSLHFEDYYQYTNMPLPVRQRIEELKASADEKELLEIHTGIVSIEQAIAQYINKYARTTKVCDLVLSFNEKLNELAAIAHLEEAIRKDKTAKAELEKQIMIIQAKISSAHNAQLRSQRIDEIDLSSTIDKKVSDYMNVVKNRLSIMMSGLSNKVEKTKAMIQCEQLEKECEALSVQIKVQIDKTLEKAYKDTISKIIDEYTKYLADLNINVNSQAMTINPANLVLASLADLKSIVERHTEIVDEGYVETRQKDCFVPSKRKWYNPFSWFKGGHWEKKSYQVRVENNVEYVDMHEVADDFIVPFQKSLDGTKKDAVTHVNSETSRLKEHLKDQLIKIDEVLKEKLNALSKIEADSKAKEDEIARKERDLKWLESIQKRVNNTIEF